jgi:two-component system NtrC family sensor kinase
MPESTDPQDAMNRLTHELNNPLSSILGFSELLLEGTLADNVRADVEKIHREALRMKRILDAFQWSRRQESSG